MSMDTMRNLDLVSAATLSRFVGPRHCRKRTWKSSEGGACWVRRGRCSESRCSAVPVDGNVEDAVFSGSGMRENKSCMVATVRTQPRCRNLEFRIPTSMERLDRCASTRRLWLIPSAVEEKGSQVIQTKVPFVPHDDEPILYPSYCA